MSRIAAATAALANVQASQDAEYAKKNYGAYCFFACHYPSM
jgi:hypothetical protein